MSDLPPWLDLASEALQAAAEGDDERAHQAVSRIGEQFGADVYPDVMCAWVDTAVDQALQGRHFRPGAVVRPVAAPGSPPAVVWAGRVFAARAAMDEDTHRALLAVMLDSGDDREWTRGLFALLLMCGALYGGDESTAQLLPFGTGPQG